MKRYVLFFALMFAWLNFAMPARAQSSPTGTNDVAQSAAAAEQASLEKRVKPILADLKLNDPSKEAKVRGALVGFFSAQRAWHQQNDNHVKDLWVEFNKARSSQEQGKADGVMGQIDGVYATFKPQHEKLLSGLAEVLSPEQIERVKDLLTVNKVKVTYDAYGEIFHGLTDEQKAFIRKNLKTAREEAMDAGSMQEKSAFFKKYKIKIDAYLTAQGYDVKKSYQEFFAKQKADMAAKKGTAGASDKPKD